MYRLLVACMGSSATTCTNILIDEKNFLSPLVKLRQNLEMAHQHHVVPPRLHQFNGVKFLGRMYVARKWPTIAGFSRVLMKGTYTTCTMNLGALPMESALQDDDVGVNKTTQR